MKKIFFSLLISCSWAAAQAQLPVYWQTPMPASFAISGSTIRGNVTAMYSDFGNSIQRLSADKDGYIEFNAEEPAAGTHFYYIGFAKASSPGTDLIGFQIASNAPSAPGYVYPSIFAPGGAATHPAYFTGSCSAIPAGSLLRIERTGNAIRFWNRTAGCELVYSASTINLSPTEDWIVIFRSLDNNKGAVNTTISFSGTEELWGRTSPTGIRPLSLSDKVGIGKDPAVALDVLGSATISTLAGTGVALTEATANGTFQRKTMGTATQTLMGNGTWAETPWKNAVSPAGAIYFQPTANRYVGINQTAPAANLDINNSTCDNKPALRITTDENWGCLVGTEHGAFIDCTSFLVGGGTAQRFMVNANGATGIGRAPSYWLDVAGSIRVNTTIYTSDSRFKKDVKEIAEPLALLKQLSGKTYQFKTKEFPEWNFEDTKQYGFIAQELKQVMPELVSEDKDGYLGVKYTMLIPVMTEAIKTQQEQIEALKQELAALRQGKTTGTPTTDAPAIDAYLAQNVPNPFTQTTEISYKLPLNVHQATIGIYDLNGREIRLVQLGQGTTGTISINGGDLKPGMYVYTLIIDGKYFDSKKMILTSQ